MTKWTKEYDNDTGPCDDYFKEWWNVTDGNRIYRCNNSDDADFLIAALAQPEQEPVEGVVLRDGYPTLTKYIRETDERLFKVAIPPQRKPDNEAYTALEQALTRLQKRYGELEAKVAAQQQPVGKWTGIEIEWIDNPYKFKQGQPIYTTSPQRPWVGLTEERIKDIWLKGKDHGDDWLDVLALARSFEAKLKEKNT